MHETIKAEIKNWFRKVKKSLAHHHVADLGSFNINGSVKDIIPNAVGFDIYQGAGVDVVIQPGLIPAEHRAKYDVVIATSSFQCCPDKVMFKNEVFDLLKHGGYLYLSMCHYKCHKKHRTSPNVYGFCDTQRMKLPQLAEFFSDKFDMVEGKTIKDQPGHRTIIYIGRLK